MAVLLDGVLANNRVQKGFDLTTADGNRVQVRYLANPSTTWVNEHLVDFRNDSCDRYALVVYEDLEPQSVLVFSKERLAEVARALGKRHEHADVMLALTRRNYLQLRAERDRFSILGVEVIDLPLLGR